MTFILDEKNLKIMYFSLVQSLPNYGILGWGGAYSNNIKPLETAKKKIIKIIYNLNRQFSSKLLFQKSKLLNIRNLFYKKSLLYLVKNNSIDENKTHTYPTRFRENANIVLPK